MTSIATNPTASTGAAKSTDKVGVRHVLRAEVDEGKISKADFEATTSALKAIRTARAEQESAEPTSSETHGKRPRFDDLVAAQVQAGNLTADQAKILIDAKATAKAAKSGEQAAGTEQKATAMRQFASALSGAGTTTAPYDRNGSNTAASTGDASSALLVDTVA